MKPAIVALTAGVALAWGAAAYSEEAKNSDVVNTSFATADGARTLQEAIIIDAPVAVLWKAFSDTTEFKRWNSPVAAIDFRVGGTLEASYDPKGALGAPYRLPQPIAAPRSFLAPRWREPPSG